MRLSSPKTERKYSQIRISKHHRHSTRSECHRIKWYNMMLTWTVVEIPHIYDDDCGLGRVHCLCLMRAGPNSQRIVGVRHSYILSAAPNFNSNFYGCDALLQHLKKQQKVHSDTDKSTTSDVTTERASLVREEAAGHRPCTHSKREALMIRSDRVTNRREPDRASRVRQSEVGFSR